MAYFDSRTGDTHCISLTAEAIINACSAGETSLDQLHARLPSMPRDVLENALAELQATGLLALRR